MVTKKDLKRTQKHLDRLTAAYIHDRPDMLKAYGKEAIRQVVLNDALRRAFASL